LILDHKMPGLAGIEVARILRGEGFRRPIILYSAYLTPQIEATAEELGVWAVAKEDVEELMDTLQDVTENGQRKKTME
jgi:CheY-like chemotaxis protein